MRQLSGSCKRSTQDYPKPFSDSFRGCSLKISVVMPNGFGNDLCTPFDLASQHFKCQVARSLWHLSVIVCVARTGWPYKNFSLYEQFWPGSARMSLEAQEAQCSRIEGKDSQGQSCQQSYFCYRHMSRLTHALPLSVCSATCCAPSMSMDKVLYLLGIEWLQLRKLRKDCLCLRRIGLPPCQSRSQVCLPLLQSQLQLFWQPTGISPSQNHTLSKKEKKNSGQDDDSMWLRFALKCFVIFRDYSMRDWQAKIEHRMNANWKVRVGDMKASLCAGVKGGQGAVRRSYQAKCRTRKPVLVLRAKHTVSRTTYWTMRQWNNTDGPQMDGDMKNDSCVKFAWILCLSICFSQRFCRILSTVQLPTP